MRAKCQLLLLIDTGYPKPVFVVVKSCLVTVTLWHIEMKFTRMINFYVVFNEDRLESPC